MKIPLFCALVLAGCTKPNPAVCCLDQADCSEVGLDEIRTCSAGLACVEHQCEVPSCSTTGCMANAPVCNITTDVCDPCTDSSQCTRFADSPVCESTSGSCVGCVDASDCAGTRPICDMNACRACRADTECPSGACGTDGACVPENDVLYLSATGTNAGTCSRAQPCKSLAYGVGQAGGSRTHIVLSPGSYSETNISISSQTTAATSIQIHGHGAGFSQLSGEGSIIGTVLPLLVRDLEFSSLIGGGGEGLNLAGGGGHRIENVTVRGGNNGLVVMTGVAVRNLHAIDCRAGILLAGGSLDLDGGVFERGQFAITTFAVSSATISNVLAWGAEQLAFDFSSVQGVASFVTVADSGTNSGAGPRAVACSQDFVIRSSIIWAPGSTARVPVDGCSLVSTIAGPTPVAGASNDDPRFVNAGAHDYHLAGNSPAKDAVDTGPATDFEGDARPRGIRFDIGADEAP